jgi:hypothetical protein
MRTTAIARLLVLWIVILGVHLFSPTPLWQIVTILFLVLLFIDWIRPPDNVNLVAAGNLRCLPASRRVEDCECSSHRVTPGCA